MRKSIVLSTLASLVLLQGCGQSAFTQPQQTTHQFRPNFQQRLLQPQFRSFNQSSNYYQSVQGKSGKNLLTGLRSLTIKHKELGYARGRDIMFGTVDDLDNDNIVEGIYTARRLNNVTDRKTAYRGGSGLNAEHTWPQSKGAVGAAKSDLHHLFPSDVKTNSRRSSYPFGVVKKIQWSHAGNKLGNNPQGKKVFEPRNEVKGNIARAILYFYTTYGGRSSTSTANFRVEQETLKAWHIQDPVDAAEKARNEAIFKHQGNRNPFVDHPEFVSKIGQFK